MNNKEKYFIFCQNVYVPIYSKSWWMDAVCGANSWDVWIYEKEGNFLAAMPYYKTEKNGYRYITKAPLTQNNGIIFNYPRGAKYIARQAFEEEIINQACKYVDELGVDVYEQQYQCSFENWLPFFWNRYKETTRYTYIIDNPGNFEETWNNISSKTRSIIKKGYRNGIFDVDISVERFYYEHEKIFKKQNLECPFSYGLFTNLAHACISNNAAKLFCARDMEGNPMSILFLVWDEKSAYHLLGGSMPEYQNKDTYSALIWEAIKFAGKKELKYDFEGSVIKRISKSFREFGGTPKPYFRIRKVFNEDIILDEAKKLIEEEKQQRKSREV